MVQEREVVRNTTISMRVWRLASFALRYGAAVVAGLGLALVSAIVASKGGIDKARTAKAPPEGSWRDRGAVRLLNAFENTEAGVWDA